MLSSSLLLEFAGLAVVKDRGWCVHIGSQHVYISAQDQFFYDTRFSYTYVSYQA